MVLGSALLVGCQQPTDGSSAGWLRAQNWKVVSERARWPRCGRVAVWAALMLPWCVSLVAQEPDSASHGEVMVSAAFVSYSVTRGPFQGLRPTGLEFTVGLRLGGPWSVGAALSSIRDAIAAGTARLNTVAVSLRNYDRWRGLLNIVTLRSFSELRPGFVWSAGSHPALADNQAGADVGLGGGFHVRVSRAISIEIGGLTTAQFFARAFGLTSGSSIGVSLQLAGPGEKR